MGVDRLDYTKGIPRRLLAFERMLRDPSRAAGAGAAGPGGGALAHQRRRPTRTSARRWTGWSGRINGAFGTPRWVPVHYIFRGLPRAGAGRALPRGRRDAGDAAARRHEPRRQGVRGLAHRRRRRAGAERVRRRRLGAARGAAGESLRRGRRRGGVLPGARRCRATERRARLAPLRTRVHTFDVHRWAPRSSSARAEITPAEPRPAPPAARPPRRALADRRLARDRRAAPAARLRRHPGAVHADARAGPARRRPARRCCGRWPRGPRPRCTSSAAGRRRPSRTGSASCPIWLHAEHGFGLARPGDPAVGAGRRSSAGAGASRCSRCCARSPSGHPARWSR